MQPDKYTFAVAHKHPDGNDDGFELFSGHDILNLAQLASNYEGEDKGFVNLYTIFLVVSGQTFAMQINDFQSMNTLKLFNKNKDKRERFNRDLINDYEKDINILTGATSNINDQQKRLFQFLGKRGIKASLLKASYNSNNEITSWEKYNENKNTYDDCND